MRFIIHTVISIAAVLVVIFISKTMGQRVPFHAVVTLVWLGTLMIGTILHHRYHW